MMNLLNQFVLCGIQVLKGPLYKEGLIGYLRTEQPICTKNFQSQPLSPFNTFKS